MLKNAISNITIFLGYLYYVYYVINIMERESSQNFSLLHPYQIYNVIKLNFFFKELMSLFLLCYFKNLSYLKLGIICRDFVH